MIIGSIAVCFSWRI